MSGNPCSPRRFRAALAALGVALAGCATAVNPVTGRPELTTMSPQREVAIGQQAAVQVEREIGLVRDPKLTGYVQAIGQRLAEASPRQDVTYRFAVADMAEANAFALPGGYVYVSRGLLALANSEDELANVIGHEIGHVAARHAAQRETRAMGVGLLSALGTLAAGLAGGGEAARMVGQLGQVAGAGLIASYGRDQERQADVVGQELAAATGWDPAGMASFLATLQREGELRTGHERQPSFLDSHPAPGERSIVARERAQQLGRRGEGGLAASRAEFLRRIEGVMVGPNPAEGIFRDGVFVHPGLGFALAFPSGWPTQNAKQAVVAMSPRRDAVIALESQGQTGDPETAARRWAQANPVEVVEARPARIGGLPAFVALARAQSQGGVTALRVAWVAHPQGMFRLTGMTSPQAYRSYAPLFDRVAGSFRTLSRAERASIRPWRLKVVQARPGETLHDLGRRTGNRWNAAETALANALDPGRTLRGGELVKVAVESAR